jgi:hypothetical protein
VRILLRDIRSDYNGFAQLISLFEQQKECVFDEIVVDMSQLSWFDANMCSPLGALLYHSSRRANTIKLENIANTVYIILSKNGFLSNYGKDSIRDIYGTTIEYKRFEPKDDRYFNAYLGKQFAGKGLPEMTTELLKKFRESIFEVFSNSVIHSQTPYGVFSCGQYFPKNNHLDFTITDLGIGIYKNVKQTIGLSLFPEQAIQWAMEKGNTTKRGPIPGGLGLKLLRDFITINKGMIQIASDGGYWALSQS